MRSNKEEVLNMIKLPELKMSKFISVRCNKTIMDTEKAGVYFLYGKNKELLYIGKAGAIRNRVNHHRRNERVGHHYYYMSYVEIDCPVDRDIYETYYINKYQPPINRDKTFLYKSSYEKYAKVYMYEKLAEQKLEEEMKQALLNFRSN